VKLVGKGLLVAFARRHADAGTSISAWTAEVEAATWHGPQDIKQRYPSASILANRKFVFNLRGNSYRLLVQVTFPTQVVLVLRIGTHAEYDKWKL